MSFMISFNLSTLDKREYLLIIRDNFCYFSIKTCYDPISEPSHQGSQHMVQMRIKKNYPLVIIKYFTYLELCLDIKISNFYCDLPSGSPVCIINPLITLCMR